VLGERGSDLVGNRWLDRPPACAKAGLFRGKNGSPGSLDDRYQQTGAMDPSRVCTVVFRGEQSQICSLSRWRAMARTPSPSPARATNPNLERGFDKALMADSRLGPQQAVSSSRVLPWADLRCQGDASSLTGVRGTNRSYLW